MVGVHRARLADARRHRPRGLRRRADGRRGAPAQRRDPGRASSSPSTRPRARCTAATARTCRRRRPRARSGSPPRRSRCPTGTCWSRTPGTTASPSWRRRRDAGPAHRVRRARAGGRRSRRGPVQRAERAVPGARRAAAVARVRRARRRHRQPRAARGPAGRRRSSPRWPGPASSTWSARRTTSCRGTRTSRTRSSRRCRSSACRATRRRPSRRPSRSPRARRAAGAVRPRPSSAEALLPVGRRLVAAARRVRRRHGRQPHALGASTTSRARSSCSAARMNEGLLDGPLHEAWFAQPSGLAVGCRRQDLAGRRRDVGAALGGPRRADRAHRVGEGLFDFGHRDGPADEARLQHPLGVAVLPDGSVVVADTYNGAVRRYADGEVTHARDGPGRAQRARRARRLARPCSSSSPPPTASRGSRCRPPVGQLVDSGAHRTQRPVTELAPGEVRLDVVFTPAPARSTTTATARPRACRSRRPRPGCCSTAPATTSRSTACCAWTRR